MQPRLLLLSAFTLLFSACATPSTPEPIETVIPTPTGEIVPTTEPTLPPVPTEPAPTTVHPPAMQTYTDDFAGFSIDYPAGWFIDASAAVNAAESFAYAVNIATWDLRNPPTPSGKGQTGIPEGGTKIEVNVWRQAMSLEEAVAQQGEGGSQIQAREDVTLATGQPGVILDFEGFAGPIRTLITTLNGNVIYVSGYGDLENFEAIALTLRPK